MAAAIVVTIFPSMTTSNDGKPWTFPIVSDKAKGCGYYGQNNGMQTVSYSTINSFIGVMNMQATLATDPSEDDWFDIDNTTLGNGITPVFDQTLLLNFTGNFVWIRGIIKQFTAGEINRVLYTRN